MKQLSSDVQRQTCHRLKLSRTRSGGFGPPELLVFFGLQVVLSKLCGLTCGVHAARVHSVINETKLRDNLTFTDKMKLFWIVKVL